MTRNPTGNISIHVLRVEDDAFPLNSSVIWQYFNPRPPCGGRLIVWHSRRRQMAFQSTSSVWRTTPRSRSTPRGGIISIHVLRVEDDNADEEGKAYMIQFQSTSSVWRTTTGQAWADGLPGNFNPRPPCGGRQTLTLDGTENWEISIHVLRVEDDRFRLPPRPHRQYFNPRPPCGGRRCKGKETSCTIVFQSTSSVWRTTAVVH